MRHLPDHLPWLIASHPVCSENLLQTWASDGTLTGRAVLWLLFWNNLRKHLAKRNTLHLFCWANSTFIIHIIFPECYKKWRTLLVVEAPWHWGIGTLIWSFFSKNSLSHPRKWKLFTFVLSCIILFTLLNHSLMTTLASLHHKLWPLLKKATTCLNYIVHMS